MPEFWSQIHFGLETLSS